MNSKPALRISSSGFSEPEQSLLLQQLKMLRSRTRARWTYLGDGHEAEITLQRGPGAGAERVAVRIAGKGGAESTTSLEWPLRLFGLLGLLEDCEQRLIDTTAGKAPSIASRLAGLESAVIIDALGLAVLPQDDRIDARQADLTQLVQELAEHGVAAEHRPLVSGPEAGAFPHSHSLKRVIWTLALAERPPGRRDWSRPSDEFRIATWPQLAEWGSTPALMRMTALFARQFATLAQAGDFAQASPTEVAAFLHACDCCGLGLEVREGSAVTPLPTRSAQPPSGFFGRLRQRLGLSVRRTG